jgi:hypothetical protein
MCCLQKLKASQLRGVRIYHLFGNNSKLICIPQMIFKIKYKYQKSVGNLADFNL